ncbi:hypothetical protein B0H19DRAFT_1252266 [Mycena capillaripes]|nr:hypothetical protein B0H19DRAFT_1252266 [Mycena capillaripes]
MSLEGSMTVAMYQGDDAEKQWQEDILRCSWFRHPYFMQLWGITTSSAVHAAVFHDEIYRHFPVLTVIYEHCYTEFSAAWYYFYSAFQQPPVIPFIEYLTSLTMTPAQQPVHILDMSLNWPPPHGAQT